MITDAQYENYVFAGLAEQEIELLLTPLANLNEQQRFIAIAAQDKYVKYVASQRAAERERINNLSDEERVAAMKPTVWTEGIYRGG